MKAPFPWFGGKSAVAQVVWERLGNVANYVEPFAGSCAVLLSRPTPFAGSETVNDADGLLANFWRALAADPGAVALHADWPVNEADLHARHLWLVGQKEVLTERLMGNPDWYDAKAAGWWVWGACAWIGSGWCSGAGPWFTDGDHIRKLPHVGDAGRGINRQLPHLSGGQGINRQLPHLSGGQGINRQLPHLSGGQGINRVLAHLIPVSERLRDVRVACGDWSRVTGPSVTWRHGVTGVFLDPPYADGAIDYNAGDRQLHEDVRAWAMPEGERPDMRIALCGYEGDHDDLEQAGWSAFAWKAAGGYGSQGNGDGRTNSARERIWFSPHCEAPAQPSLFATI